jgi:hypothetical protein
MSKKESQKEQQDADAPIINPGGFGNRLLLTQGNGFVLDSLPFSTGSNGFCSRFVGQASPMPNGTGMGIPPVSHFSSHVVETTDRYTTGDDWIWWLLSS